MSTDYVSGTTPRISVIIAAYNSQSFIGGCLRALSRQTILNFETIVINSSPEKETQEIVSAFPGVRFHQSAERLMPHAARNTGVAMARGEALVFTDADCFPEPTWLERIVATHDAGCEVVCGVIGFAERSASGMAMHLVKYMPYLPGLPARRVKIGATGNLLVSRKIWNEVGPFVGGIFSGDALFSWRLDRAGYPIQFAPDAVVLDRDDKLTWDFLRSRFMRGREFGRIRAEFEAWSSTRRFIHGAMAPLAAIRVLGSGFPLARQAGVMMIFILTIPLQLFAHLCWCLGESTGYLDQMRHKIRR